MLSVSEHANSVQSFEALSAPLLEFLLAYDNAAIVSIRVRQNYCKRLGNQVRNSLTRNCMFGRVSVVNVSIFLKSLVARSNLSPSNETAEFDVVSNAQCEDL